VKKQKLVQINEITPVVSLPQEYCLL